LQDVQDGKGKHLNTVLFLQDRRMLRYLRNGESGAAVVYGCPSNMLLSKMFWLI
jgi:hypothetical protein